MFVYKRCAKGINDDMNRTIFLRGINDESKEALNLMGKGDINKILLQEIINICRNYSRTRVGTRDFRKQQSFRACCIISCGGIVKLKTNILLHLNT